MKERFKQNRNILLILLMFSLMQTFVLFRLSLIRWDEAVYIGAGKYLFSLGKAGFLEASRPILLPLLDGLLWFIHLNPVVFGKILALAFSLGCIYVSYLVAKELFSDKVAALSAMMVAFSPVFFFFSSFAMTGIPATFFILVAFYLLIKQKYFFSGLLFSLGFMTRFLLLFAIISAITIFLFKPKIKNTAQFWLGFFIPLAPYLALNYFLYGNIAYPFVLQGIMTATTGFVFHKAWWYYFFWLFKENILLYLSPIAFFLILKERKTERLSLASMAAVFFIFHTLIPHKEGRFMVTFLPVLYMLSSFSFFYMLSKIKNKKFKACAVGIVVALIAANWLAQAKIDNGPSYYHYMRDYLKKEGIKGEIWVSNPVFAVDADYRIGNLMYYPTFNHEKFLSLKEKIGAAGHVLLNTCDLYCEPYNSFCEDDKRELVSLLKSSLNEVFYKKEGECESYIFRR
jgi:4-amino-4-deoxy-L-arabinose transferase-like glycosyltransferase